MKTTSAFFLFEALLTLAVVMVWWLSMVNAQAMLFQSLQKSYDLLRATIVGRSFVARLQSKLTSPDASNSEECGCIIASEKNFADDHGLLWYTVTVRRRDSSVTMFVGLIA